jgi:hypothetical protein
MINLPCKSIQFIRNLFPANKPQKSIITIPSSPPCISLPSAAVRSRSHLYPLRFFITYTSCPHLHTDQFKRTRSQKHQTTTVFHREHSDPADPIRSSTTILLSSAAAMLKPPAAKPAATALLLYPRRRKARRCCSSHRRPLQPSIASHRSLASLPRPPTIQTGLLAVHRTDLHSPLCPRKLHRLCCRRRNHGCCLLCPLQSVPVATSDRRSFHRPCSPPPSQASPCLTALLPHGFSHDLVCKE